MSNRISLIEATRRIENDGEKICTGNFESFEDFINYFEIHYKPILKELEKEWAGADDARRFLASDLLEMFTE